MSIPHAGARAEAALLSLRGLQDVEFATLEWVWWFNRHVLLEHRRFGAASCRLRESRCPTTFQVTGFSDHNSNALLTGSDRAF